MKTVEVINELKRRFPGEPEYYQAVQEVLESIEDVYNEHPEFEAANLVERLCIPERMFTFRVTWTDDKVYKATFCRIWCYRKEKRAWSRFQS